MAYRLLNRTKSMAFHLRIRSDLSLRITYPCNPAAPSPCAMQLLGAPTLLSTAFVKNLHDVHSTAAARKEETKYTKSLKDGSHKILATSPLESTTVKELKRGLDVESLKTRRFAQSKKVTYALIPALFLVSKSNLLTSVLVLSVYWQIYGFYKENFQDYIHHELTRRWVLSSNFAVLLIILVKDTLVYYDLV